MIAALAIEHQFVSLSGPINVKSGLLSQTPTIAQCLQDLCPEGIQWALLQQRASFSKTRDVRDRRKPCFRRYAPFSLELR